MRKILEKMFKTCEKFMAKIRKNEENGGIDVSKVVGSGVKK